MAIWSVAEQVVSDNATGMRFEFDATSGTMPVLRIFTKERTRVLVLMFANNGTLLKSDVRGVRDGSLEDVGQAAFQELHQDPVVADAATQAAADLSSHDTSVGDYSRENNPLDPRYGPVTSDELEAAAKIGEPAGDTDAAIAEEEKPRQGVFYEADC